VRTPSRALGWAAFAVGSAVACSRPEPAKPAAAAPPKPSVTVAQAAPAPTPSPARAPLEASELFRLVSPSVVVVEAIDRNGVVIGNGSGVVIEKGMVVTNAHVTVRTNRLRIRSGESTWQATVSSSDAAHDLSLLLVPGLEAKPVEIRASATLNVGERVYSTGAPRGLELTLGEGIVSGLRAVKDGRLVQTSAPISPGSSGGGLFDTQGRLVGITTFQFREAQNINFALPTEWVESIAKGRAVSGTATTADAKPTASGGSQLDLNKAVGFRTSDLLRELPEPQQKRLREIVMNVIRKRRDASAYEYRDFWVIMNTVGPLSSALTARLMDELGGLNLRYERALWDDAVEARVMRSPAKSPLRADLEKRMVAFGFAKEEEIQARDNLIARVAERQQVTWGTTTLVVDESVCKMFITEIDASQERLNRLFTSPPAR